MTVETCVVAVSGQIHLVLPTVQLPADLASLVMFVWPQGKQLLITD
jgi:hypothetical protein